MDISGILNFDLYKNQIEINTVEIENELEQIVNIGKTLQKFNISEIEISAKNISEKRYGRDMNL